MTEQMNEPMKKYLVAETIIEDPDMMLAYYLVRQGQRVGVEVREIGGESAVCMIPDTEENVQKFLNVLARGTVMPGNVQEVADDYLSSKSLLETASQLLQTYLNTAFDSR